jgi:hypothetical protein
MKVHFFWCVFILCNSIVVVISKVCKLARLLQLYVVTSSKLCVNAVVSPEPVSSF